MDISKAGDLFWVFSIHSGLKFSNTCCFRLLKHNLPVRMQTQFCKLIVFKWLHPIILLFTLSSGIPIFYSLKNHFNTHVTPKSIFNIVFKNKVSSENTESRE